MKNIATAANRPTKNRGEDGIVTSRLFEITLSITKTAYLSHLYIFAFNSLFFVFVKLTKFYQNYFLLTPLRAMAENLRCLGT